MITGGSAFELRLNDLFDPVRPDFDHPLVVHFAGPRYAEDVAAGSNRVKDHPRRASHAALSLIIHINFRA